MSALDAFSSAVDAEINNTKRELTDIMNVDSPLRDRVRNERGMDGIQRAVHAIIRLQTRMHAVKAAAALATTGDLPIGTPVTYWPGVREGSGVPSVTRSNVWTVGGNPVVLVNGYAGAIALTHIERRLVDQIETARPESEVKAEGLREAAEIWREIARNAHTRDGIAEATDRADWLDEHANHIDPRRLEGAHP